jgi:hypothetical protein
VRRVGAEVCALCLSLCVCECVSLCVCVCGVTCSGGLSWYRFLSRKSSSVLTLPTYDDMASSVYITSYHTHNQRESLSKPICFMPYTSLLRLTHKEKRGSTNRSENCV